MDGGIADQSAVGAQNLRRRYCKEVMSTVILATQTKSSCMTRGCGRVLILIWVGIYFLTKAKNTWSMFAILGKNSKFSM